MYYIMVDVTRNCAADWWWPMSSLELNRTSPRDGQSVISSSQQTNWKTSHCRFFCVTHFGGHFSSARRRSPRQRHGRKVAAPKPSKRKSKIGVKANTSSIDDWKKSLVKTCWVVRCWRRRTRRWRPYWALLRPAWSLWSSGVRRTRRWLDRFSP